MVYPSYTWGLGRQYKQQDGLLINYTYLRFHQQLLKRISRGLFTGIGYHLDYHAHITTGRDKPLLKDYAQYSYGTSGPSSVSSGVSLNLLFDTRTNSLNPWDGRYLALQFRFNPTFLGNNHQWKSVYLDVRKYIRFERGTHRQNMLAVWGYLWTVLDKQVPYLDLPSLGWEEHNRSGRGFDQSRYRGRTLLYTEAEFRKDITDNGFLGLVLFANANTVSGPRSILLIHWNPAVGGGIRIKMNERSATNIGLNYARSLHHVGVNLTLGEVF
ncbi:Surface antigen [Dyadobacter sp. SG02]|nr:Surface antigen [Dyadobacter sp. SG02]